MKIENDDYQESRGTQFMMKPFLNEYKKTTNQTELERRCIYCKIDPFCIKRTNKANEFVFCL